MKITPNDIVQRAIDTTKEYFGDYFQKTCAQRIYNGKGSVFTGITNIQDMENALRAAKWVAAEHKDVAEGCKAFKTTDIPGGNFGLAEIESLPDDVVIMAQDPKGTGMISMVACGEANRPVDETWLIIGEEEGKEIVFTFHPGEPIPPSRTSVEQIHDGQILTKQEALALGFKTVKLQKDMPENFKNVCKMPESNNGEVREIVHIEGGDEKQNVLGE